MDLFGDMLADEFAQSHSMEIDAVKLRPEFRRRFSLAPGFAMRPFLWNADRLLNRFYDYRIWLRKKAGRFDVFDLIDHSYAQLINELPPGRVVVRCHDLDTFRCLFEPDQEPRPLWFRAMTRPILAGLSRATHVICNSQWTKSQVLRYGIAPEPRTSVLYPGVRSEFFAPIDSMIQDQNFAIPSGSGQVYFLHVGSTIPRKRIDVLLRVFASVLKEMPELQLVRVGGAFTEEQAQLAKALNVDHKIVVVPAVSVSILKCIYERAILLLQTSDAEGFGIPVIEAQACGCPVVASDLPVLREAGGEAAEYSPVADTEAWKQKILSLLHEREMQPARWELRRAAARRHAARFTWARNAVGTIAIYKSVLSDRPAGSALCKEALYQGHSTD